MAKRKFGPLSKQPSELFPVSVDFADDIDSAETVLSAVITVYDADGEDVSNIILSGSVSIVDGADQGGTVHTNSKVIQKIQAGTDGVSYTLTYVATTSTGNVYEADIKLKVRERK